jgi:hypothetical protein
MSSKTSAIHSVPTTPNVSPYSASKTTSIDSPTCVCSFFDEQHNDTDPTVDPDVDYQPNMP